MRIAPKYLSASSLLVQANTIVPSGSSTLSLLACPLVMFAGCAGSQVRPPSCVLRIQSSSLPLHQVAKFTSVSRNFANSSVISPLWFLIQIGSCQQ